MPKPKFEPFLRQLSVRSRVRLNRRPRRGESRNARKARKRNKRAIDITYRRLRVLVDVASGFTRTMLGGPSFADRVFPVTQIHPPS